MIEEKEPEMQSDFFVVSDAGSKEVNGVYKNLDGNSNDNTLNYKMKNREGRTFKLYRSPSEDQSVRYWIIEERNADYYYLAFSDHKIPPETNWTPYVRGQARPPEVTKVPREVEYELRTRIENKDSLTTLDLIDQYGKWCETPALKRLYRVLWEEQPPELKEAVKVAARALARSKSKKRKTPMIKQKITIKIQLGIDSSEGEAAKCFELMINADTIVRFLKQNIAKQLNMEPDRNLELMFNGHKVLSREAQINKLGIGKGSKVIVLDVKSEISRATPAGQTGLRKSALPPLDEVDDQPVSPSDQGPSAANSSDIGITPKSKKGCAIQ